MSCSRSGNFNGNIPWLTWVSTWLEPCAVADLLLCWGLSMVFLDPVCCTESPSVCCVWATGRRRLDRSAGWVTDFLLLSTKRTANRQQWRGDFADVFSLFLQLNGKNKSVLTVWAEVFIGAVWTVLLPITSIGDVNTAAVVALELIVWTVTCTHC